MKKYLLSFALLLSALVVAGYQWLDHRSRDLDGFGFLSCFGNNRGRVENAAQELDHLILEHFGLRADDSLPIWRASRDSNRVYWFAIDADRERWTTLLSSMREASQSTSRIWKIKSVGNVDPNGASIAPEWWPRPSQTAYDTWEFDSTSDRRDKHPSIIMFRIGYDPSSRRIYLCNIRG